MSCHVSKGDYLHFPVTDHEYSMYSTSAYSLQHWTEADFEYTCTLQVIAMKAPGFGERKSSYLEDIAILTGAQVVKEELGLSLDKVCLSDL